MPIYAYRCTSCGHAKDVLQKLSDPLLTTCSACGQETFSKQVTAAGFQLKGAGWYVTDFRGGEKGGEGANSGIAKEPGAKPTGDAAPAKTGDASSTPSPAPASAPAPAASAAPSTAASPAPAPKSVAAPAASKSA
jgi:putative FmdB family regulatory protein